MAGIDNLVNQILQEATQKADDLIAQGKEKADEIARQAAAESEKLSQASMQAAQKGVKDLAERAKSQSALRRRQALLATKQEIIDEIIDKAYKKLETQDDAEYFSMIAALAEKAARPGDGEICFNREDMERIPADFAAKIEKIAAAKGGSLKISSVPAKIRSGFILSYGGIEENCTLDSIFAEKKDALRDLVNSILW